MINTAHCFTKLMTQKHTFVSHYESMSAVSFLLVILMFYIPRGLCTLKEFITINNLNVMMISEYSVISLIDLICVLTNPTG